MSLEAFFGCVCKGVGWAFKSPSLEELEHSRDVENATEIRMAFPRNSVCVCEFQNRTTQNSGAAAALKRARPRAMFLETREQEVSRKLARPASVCSGHA